MLKIILYYLLFIIHLTISANILLVPAPSMKSHALSMIPIAESLARNGHNVSFYYESFASTGKNDLSKIVPNIGIQYKHLVENMTSFSKNLWGNPHRHLYVFYQWMIATSFAEEIVKQGSRTQFEAIVDQSWDLVIGDSKFCVPGVVLSRKHSFVQFHISYVLSIYGTSTGSEQAISATSPLFLSHSRGRWEAGHFYDRVDAALKYTIHMLIFLFINADVVRQGIRILENNLDAPFSWVEHNERTLLHLLDFPSSLSPPQPATLETQTITAPCQTWSAKDENETLPDDIDSFLNDPVSKGTIYIALGTLSDFHYAPNEVMDSFVYGTGNMSEYRFIWANYMGPAFRTPNNVLVKQWMPPNVKNVILYHPHTKAFLGHAGLKSTYESICAGVPSLYMPLIAEQPYTAWNARKRGNARYLNKFQMSPDVFESELRALIENKSYKMETNKLRQLFNENIVSGPTLATHWLNKLLRYKERLRAWIRPRGAWITNWSRFYANHVFIVVFLYLAVL